MIDNKLDEEELRANIEKWDKETRERFPKDGWQMLEQYKNIVKQYGLDSLETKKIYNEFVKKEKEIEGYLDAINDLESAGLLNMPAEDGR